MKRPPLFQNWKKFATISFGIVYVLFNLWVIFNIPQFAPEGQEDIWYRIFISYGLMSAWIFGNADMRNKLFDVKFVDFAPRFAGYLVFFLVVFYFILSYVDPVQGTFFSLLSSIPLYLALAHAFTFAVTESIIWQGYLDEAVGKPFSALIAGVFHMFIWSGGAFIVMISAGLLFLGFSIIHWFFRKSENDMVPVIASHTAYNYVKLGILLGGSLL